MALAPDNQTGASRAEHNYGRSNGSHRTTRGEQW